VLGLQTGETDIQANDIIAAIDFSAPNEGTGTDANTVAAAIVAFSEGDFAADNNATSLSFRTGAAGSATEKMKLSSGGVLTLDTALASTDLFIIKTSGNSGTGLYINSQTANQIDLVGYDGGAATAVNIRSGGASGSGILVDTSNDTKITGVLTLTGEGSNTTNATKGVAKSWAKATGSGTASLDDSLNVGSLTDNGTGDYTFTLSTNMGNVNACLTANSGQATTRSIVNCTTSTFDIDLFDSDGSTRGDSGRVFGALHGDLS